MPAYSQKTADAIAKSGIPMSADAGRMTAEREAEIRERVATRGAELTAWMNAHSPTPGQEVIGHAESVLEEDVPELLAELAAVRKERDEAKAALERRTEDLAFLERATLPELRRTIQHHEDGKKRWRDRAEMAEPERDALKQRVDAVLDLCDREQRNAMRWENPIPVPDWVAPVQRAALGDDKRTAGDAS